MNRIILFFLVVAIGTSACSKVDPIKAEPVPEAKVENAYPVGTRKVHRSESFFIRESGYAQVLVLEEESPAASQSEAESQEEDLDSDHALLVDEKEEILPVEDLSSHSPSDLAWKKFCSGQTLSEAERKIVDFSNVPAKWENQCFPIK